MAIVEANGRTLGYERSGEGPPLVLINGFAATRADWDPAFLAALAEHNELIALDNRGVGESAPAKGSLTVADMASDACAVIGSLALDRPAILGWSLGGFIAQEMALSRPGRLRALVLLSSSPGGGAATPSDPAVWARLLDASGAPREQASRLISLLFTPQRAAQVDAEAGDLIAAARAKLDPAVLERQAAAMDCWAAEGAADALAELDLPALVACGSADQVIPPANSMALATAIPNAWLARFPDCGHAFMADRPRELAALIAAFLGAAER